MSGGPVLGAKLVSGIKWCAKKVDRQVAESAQLQDLPGIGRVGQWKNQCGVHLNGIAFGGPGAEIAGFGRLSFSCIGSSVAGAPNGRTNILAASNSGLRG